MQLALFVVILIGIDRAVYVTATNVRDNDISYGKLAEVYGPSTEYDIVIFGSSRAYLHYDPEEISGSTGRSVFNFGLDGANIEYQLFALEQYLRQGGRPELVMFEADAESLDVSQYRFKRELFREYVPESTEVADLFVSESNPVVEPVERFALTNGLKSWAFAGRLESLARSWLLSDSADFCLDEHKCEYRGGSILIGEERSLEYLEEELADRRKELQIDEARLELFREVMELSAEYGFKLALVETPRYKEEAVIDEAVLSEAREFYCDLASASSSAAFLFPSDDARWDDPALYFSGDHLNAAGATEMSRLIGPEAFSLLNGSTASECRAY